MHPQIREDRVERLDAEQFERLPAARRQTDAAAVRFEYVFEENTHVLVQDEGAYLRVLSPRVCRLSRAGLEAATGSAIRFPGDLEVVMSSFTGVMQLTEDGAVWRLAGERPAETAAPRAGGR